tara:strand:- start:85 stop:243 length:159 start_codon:yes stop_codon:yes gene_type:complete
MREIVVEGLDYEDFLFIKKLAETSTFKIKDESDFRSSKILVEKINQILKAFD